MDEEHDVSECDECNVRSLTVNGHVMEVILPCNQPGAYWACITCDQIEFWLISEDTVATNDLITATLYIHCLDRLVMT